MELSEELKSQIDYWFEDRSQEELIYVLSKYGVMDGLNFFKAPVGSLVLVPIMSREDCEDMLEEWLEERLTNLK